MLITRHNTSAPRIKCESGRMSFSDPVNAHGYDHDGWFANGEDEHGRTSHDVDGW